MSIQEQVIRQLEDFILAEHELYRADKIPFEHQGKTAYGYPYIRSTNDSFETALHACSRLIEQPASAIRFLEVGCGLGTKCEIARLHGVQASGVDLKQEYVELARQIFQDCTFVQANAFDFDYSDYDLVYYHVPFFEDTMLFQLEVRILSQLPVESVLFVTRLSEMLQQAIYDENGIKPSFRSILFDPCLELGRIRVLQKTATLENGLIELFGEADQ